MPKSPVWSDFISAPYLGEQRRLHLMPEGYGGRGSKWAAVVASLIITHRARNVLDYGCGQATLQMAATHLTAKDPEAQGLPNSWRNYDPAVREFERVPDPEVQTFDLVVCTDMLEHVEPEKIERVLTHMRRLTRDGGHLFTVISTVPTAKLLSDGRQAHILLRDAAWWADSFEGAQFEAVDHQVENPKPEKQLVNLWRPV